MSTHKAEYSTTANCRPEHVWQVFSNLERWAEWNPSIAAAKWVEGEPWKQGSQLKLEFKDPPLQLKLTLVEITAPLKVVLRGEVMGVTALNEFHFAAGPNGHTKIQHVQELAGMALSFMPDSMKAQTVKNMETGLESLKREAEKLTKDDTVA